MCIIGTYEWHVAQMKIIKERCPRCAYGAWKGNAVKCSFWTHPGWISGCGSETFAQCADFSDTGKVGRIVEHVERE